MPFIVLSENVISAFYERLAVFDTAFMRPVTFYVKPSVEMLMRYDRWTAKFIGNAGSVQNTQALLNGQKTAKRKFF